MSGPNDSEPPGDPSVLAKLPRTRPQRSSPRRAAARAKSATGAQSEAPPPPAAEQPAGAAASGTSPNGRAKSAARKSDARKPSQSRNGAGSTRQARTSSSAANRPQSGGRARPAAGAASTPAPRQGFESESEHPSRTINPPGGAELVASVAEVLGEFAKAGLSTGERLLKDAFSRLPLS
jgi:hypothetical protein